VLGVLTSMMEPVVDRNRAPKLERGFKEKAISKPAEHSAETRPRSDDDRKKAEAIEKKETE
jgi:hypothetical protein